MKLFKENNIINEQYKILPGSGVNIEEFQPKFNNKMSKKISFLFIGRLMKEKGIEEYLKAADVLTDIYNNIEFQILGFYEEKKYKEMLEENKNTNIKYLGVSSDVRNEINKADCMVNPSYHEGMSNALLEGAAMGKPLLASNIPGCKEIIEEDKNGFLFEPKSVESLKKSVENFIKLTQTEREQMGKYSREKIVKEFDRQIVVDSYVNEIKNILEEEYE